MLSTRRSQGRGTSCVSASLASAKASNHFAAIESAANKRSSAACCQASCIVQDMLCILPHPHIHGNSLYCGECVLC
jgi:hypothetical protein